MKALEKIENKLLASYRLTRYFVLYVARLALKIDDTGKDCCSSSLSPLMVGLASVALSRR
jgi:hypothetical protein